MRKPRCRLLDRLSDRCPNEEIGDTGLCGHHLAEAAADFQRIIADAALITNTPDLRGGDG